jgi:diguanylate cyclase (GGDEF)-like protein
MTDELTGLLNRRGLNFFIAGLVEDRSREGADSVMAIVIDLDRFKSVNDSFGHATGDAVLVRSARRIVHSVRGSALVARLGGEEFVVVDTAPAEHTPAIAERIRTAISAPADIAPVTASVGVATVALADFRGPGSEPSAVLAGAIERADRAMFDAKRTGGDATAQQDKDPKEPRCQRDCRPDRPCPEMVAVDGSGGGHIRCRAGRS